MSATSEKHAGIDFDSMDWRVPPLGWPSSIANVPFILSAGARTDSPSSWLEGSNCQRFAFGVLSLFDLNCPPLRSSNLWEENEFTTVVSEPEPLDLAFSTFPTKPTERTLASIWRQTKFFTLPRKLENLQCGLSKIFRCDLDTRQSLASKRFKAVS